MKPPHSSRCASLLIAAPLTVITVCSTSLAGCSGGSSGGSSNSGGSSGGGNAPPSIAGFTVTDANDSHACRVQFTLRDPESDAASVELLYEVPGSPPQLISHIAPVAGIRAPPSNPATLATSASGVQYAFQWDFASEALLPDDGGFVEDARVFAHLAGSSELLPAANTHAGIGNDPPQVVEAQSPKEQEVVGIAALPFTVADSSSDTISIRVEFDIVGDVPDAGWRIARPAGIPSIQPTPELAFGAVVADAEGTDLFFFWNTSFDLAHQEHDVVLRFTPSDDVATGDAVSTPVFYVDNNAEPIATVSEGLLILNDDQRAGIPIPYTVSDQESDEVEVVFQWKRSSEVGFPPLPNTPAEIDAILTDPEQRQEKHICTEYPTWVEGSVVPIDADSVRLPELATSAASILAHGLVGRELEILRASKLPRPIAATWESNPLARPVAALPIGDGIEALVLDRQSAGAWRLRRIDLATGVVRALVPAAPGEPTAMALEHGEESVIVASDSAGVWRLTRVTLANGAITPLIAFDGSTESGPIRGLGSQGSSSALVTVGSSLIRLEFSDALPARAVTLFDDLATPWGVAIDPLNTNRVYVAERDAETADGTGRIVWIRLDTLERRPIVAPPVVRRGEFGHAISLPRALAVDRSGSRLLAITRSEPGDGTWDLTAIDLGGPSANRAFRLLSELPAPAASIATGADDLLVLALSAEHDLYVGGGLEQRRIIEDLELTHHVVHVSTSFAPALTAAQPFRVRIPSSVGRPSPIGTRDTFVWDSADVPEGGPVQLRAIPMDAETGVAGSTEAPKRIRPTLDTEPVVVADTSVMYGASSVIAADLDGDGDLDLASSGNHNDSALKVFFQESPGDFGPTPLTLGNWIVTDRAESVVAADLDGDGDADLASANQDSDNLTVFFQTSPGVFGLTPLSLGNASVTDRPMRVTAADLDGDGDLDLASANEGSHTLTVFFQQSPGVFGSTPLSLGNSSVTWGPSSVVAADLDGDGDVDLASANYAYTKLAVFFQESPGVFSSTPLSVGGAAGFIRPERVTAADLDGDGDLDLAASNVGHELIVFFQESPGVFSSTPLSLGTSSMHGSTGVVAADLDGDEDLDLVSASGGSPPLNVFFQQSPGVFGSTPLSVGAGSGVLYASSVTAADLDGDGDLDLALANRFGQPLTVFFQEGPGVFGSTPSSVATKYATRPHDCVTTGDIDGDGDLDLVSANDGYNFGDDGNTLTIFFQESPGIFSPTALTLGNLMENWGATSVVAADLDGDGDLDLASANWRSDTLGVFFQESPGVFGSTQLRLGNIHFWKAEAEDAPYSVTAADLDSDGDLDLASANWESSTLFVFFQTSPGVFGAQPLSLGNASVTSRPLSVAAADLDGDGDVDLASANSGNQKLSVFFQESPGVFGATPLSLGGVIGKPESLVAADLDGDGDIDLATANESNRLTVFFQESPGVFGSPPLTLTVGGAGSAYYRHSVTAADFDGDGDLDLASSNGGSTLTVFFQESPGVFGATPLALGNASGTDYRLSVTAADVDGDGDRDVVSGNYGSFSVFWNNH